METITPGAPLPKLPSRAADAHKGSFGRVLIIGGSDGMAGAPALAAIAALRSGAGLVTVACPRPIAAIVAGFEPSYMTMPLPADADGRISIESVFTKLQNPTADVIALGPGLGRGDTLAGVVGHVVGNLATPMVIDADALSLLAGRLPLMKKTRRALVLTPHPGEFARLTGLPVADIQANRAAYAARFAAAHEVIVVLKGHGTVISDGKRVAVNATGNPGMATGGAGDVLTGVIAALMAQGLDAFAAARLGAHVHGLAGDLAVARGSQAGLIASDLAATLPLAFREITTT